MLMRITLSNELCTVLESTLFTFSEYLGVSNQSNIDTLLANQRYVIMHYVLLYW